MSFLKSAKKWEDLGALGKAGSLVAVVQVAPVRCHPLPARPAADGGTRVVMAAFLTSLESSGWGCVCLLAFSAPWDPPGSGSAFLVSPPPATATHHGPTMWAGTNSGSVFAYALEVPSQDKFSERSVEAILGKEIQLMHRAPVVSIAVLDGRGNPLPEPYEVSRDLARAPDMQGSHAVLIASEEQFKVSAGGGGKRVASTPVVLLMSSAKLYREGLGNLSKAAFVSLPHPRGAGAVDRSKTVRSEGREDRPHSQLSPAPGLHAAQGQRQDQVQADGPRGLPGPEGGAGELCQRSLRGLHGELPGVPDEPGRHPRLHRAGAEAAGALRLHPQGGHQRHRLLRVHQARAR